MSANREGGSARGVKALYRYAPIAAVLAVLILLMYPVALMLGLPLARKRMENLANWVISSTGAHPLMRAPMSGDAAAPAGAPGGARLEFGSFGELLSGEGRDLSRLVLVRGSAPVEASFSLDGDAVVLGDAISGPLLEFGAELEGPLDDAGLTYRVPAELLEGGRLNTGSALYVGDRLIEGGAVDAMERADGVSAEFTFPEASGPVLVGRELYLEGEGFHGDGQRVTLSEAPPFNAVVRRMTGDYAFVHGEEGVIVLSAAAEVAPRVASNVLAVAELLLGEVNGTNRTFHLQHHPLLEGDPARRLMLNGEELTATAERPAERVDGQQREFTFVSGRGVVTVNGEEAAEGSDFTRSGNMITFASPPPRNAQLRQHRDYRVSDRATGAVSLAVAPQPGDKLWAASYSYYDRPACGSTDLECFFSMPQHPMPFPHWIAQRIGPFLSAYPITDSRNVIRATLYTASGTLLALLLGGLVGVLLAVVFVAVRPAERALLPWVIASQTVPIIALVPVLLLLLGNAGVTVQTSLVPAALIGAYIAFFPVAVGTVTGLRSVDPLALDLMRSYAATPLEVFFKVRFPAAVPFFFTSLKLGAAAALVGALVAETESNNRYGLGYSIVGQVQAGNVSDVWILLLISAFLGIGLVALVGGAQRLLAPWERR